MSKRRVTKEQRTFSLYGESRSYTLYRSDRKTLQISVDPNSNITVRAPKKTDLEDIEAVLNKRTPWIDKTLKEVAQLPPPVPPRQWISGETHRYLGRQYRLKIFQGEFPEVKLKGGFFCIQVPNTENKAHIEKLMMQWYRNHAFPIFQQRLCQCQEQSKAFLELHHADIPLLVRSMKSRWGSYTRTGRIVLNLELIKAPLDCIEYVIMHELCHVREMNHSHRFWQLMEQCMPDWKRRREKLRRLEI